MPRNLGKTPPKKHKITRGRASNQLGSEIKYITHWLAVIANRNPAFSIRHEGTHRERLVESSRMSYSLIRVRVALAASDVPSILDIPATDDINMEDRNYGWVLPEASRTMAYTPRKTVYRLARGQVH